MLNQSNARGRVQGFDYIRQLPLDVTLSTARELCATGRRRVENGETFVHHGSVLAYEFYGNVSAPKAVAADEVAL